MLGRPVVPYDRAVAKEHALNGRRALRFSFTPGFRLPELEGQELEARVFTSTYFDSKDRALARAHLTLRRRIEKGKSVWRLLSSASSGTRVEAPGGPAGPPDELRSLLVGALGDRSLEQVVKVRVRRSGLALQEGSKELVAVIVDDVAVLDGRRVTERIKELRLELVEGDEDLLTSLSKSVRRAGAVSTGDTSRLGEVLGFGRELKNGKPGWSATDLVAEMLACQLVAIVAHDPGTRLGADPEELHAMRVATRRSRAILRTARPLLDPAWTESLRAELAWLAGSLGEVRDLDVFCARLEAGVARLGARERRAGKKLVALVATERGEARGRLVEALSSERYQALLVTLQAAADSPAFVPAEVDVRELAAKQFHKLRKVIDALGRDPTDELLHRARIKAKHARYAAEVAAGRDGKAAARYLQRAKRLQDVLGEHQDAVVADRKLRALAVQSGGTTTAFAAGRLAELERGNRRAAREALPKAWRRLEQAGARAWA